MKASETSRRIGLARALSKLGYCSRSQASALIRAGRIRLNGTIRRNPESPVHLQRDRISVDGKQVRDEEKVYLMMNKPRGMITTASDDKGRTTVYSLLKKGLANVAGRANAQNSPPWLGPVGRLDKASEGLLLLTNDSEWGARITAPEAHLDKTYHVQIARLADEELLEALVRGVKTDEGNTLRAKRARLLRSGQKNCWLEIILDEGKNRHLRRMLGALGIEVLRLVRVSIGPLELGELPKGAVRRLTPVEKRLLDGS